MRVGVPNAMCNVQKAKFRGGVRLQSSNAKHKVQSQCAMFKRQYAMLKGKAVEVCKCKFHFQAQRCPFHQGLRPQFLSNARSCFQKVSRMYYKDTKNTLVSLIESDITVDTVTHLIITQQ